MGSRQSTRHNFPQNVLKKDCKTAAGRNMIRVAGMTYRLRCTEKL
ncbi:hypothetical protein KNP414_05304 [Paenibacillus mucilaginosus KNP414]|uniref:Uncharacterized protein n=1 Tax=Paenibacillus mucilaginosus (strain KNP414) TaxID=1036673 RepID=F8FE69_PAEMK|nr:hypothetical protein KNP414_05304 [Paenibacillus mucilaginosus KNP414]